MPRYEYEMIFPTNGVTTIKGNTLKELSEKSGYTLDIIFNKIKNDAKRTNIISIKRVLTKESEMRDTKRKESNKIVDKNRQKIRTNKKYNYEVEKDGEKHTFSKLKHGSQFFNITPSFMYKILNSEDLRNEYKVKII